MFQTDFFEEVAKSLDYWIREGAKVTTKENADLGWTDHPASFLAVQKAIVQKRVSEDDVRAVLTDILSGFVVSFLTILDGGTSLAEKQRIMLVDEKGEVLGEELHQEFINYLFQTGRMT